jgi:hypothetical protein
MNFPHIEYKDGRPSKKVKNLGWLLRNHAGVKELQVIEYAQSTGKLLAFFDDKTYVCEFASIKVLFGFIHRPIFSGVSVKVVREDLSTYTFNIHLKDVKLYT